MSLKRGCPAKPNAQERDELLQKLQPEVHLIFPVLLLPKQAVHFPLVRLCPINHKLCAMVFHCRGQPLKHFMWAMRVPSKRANKPQAA